MDRYIQEIGPGKETDPKREAVFFGIEGEEKIESFERILDGRLRMSDSISSAIEKIVSAALSVEFGERFVQKKEAESMIKTISRGILTDTELRRQALIIVDRFAKAEVLNS